MLIYKQALNVGHRRWSSAGGNVLVKWIIIYHWLLLQRHIPSMSTHAVTVRRTFPPWRRNPGIGRCSRIRHTVQTKMSRSCIYWSEWKDAATFTSHSHSVQSNSVLLLLGLLLKLPIYRPLALFMLIKLSSFKHIGINKTKNASVRAPRALLSCSNVIQYCCLFRFILATLYIARFLPSCGLCPSITRRYCV